MDLLINALVNAAGWSIMHSLWQGAALYILLLILFIANPGLTAKTKHNLSFMALGGTFVWFIKTFCTEFAKWLDLGRSVRAFTLSGLPLKYAEKIQDVPASLLFKKAEQSIPLIVFIYSLGLIIQIVLLITGYLKVRQIRKTGLSELSPSLTERFYELRKQLGISRAVRFVQSSLVSVPMVIGYFKPVVLLPLSVLTQFSPQQLEAIVVHELSHIRRNDYILNILKVCIETILFFNPFVWLSGRLIDAERENACDDLVLKATGSPLSYAMTLLELEKLKHDHQAFSMAVTGKKFHLLNRIKRITNMKTSNTNLKIQLFAILIAIGGVFSLAFIPAKTKKEIKSTIVSPSQKTTLTIVYDADELSDKTDTTRKKIKIIIEDGKGNKKEYKSLAEMPAEIRAEFEKENDKAFSPLTFNIDTAFFKTIKNFAVKFDTGYFKAMKDFKVDTAFLKAFKNHGFEKDSMFIANGEKFKNLKAFRVTKDGHIIRMDSTKVNYTIKALKDAWRDTVGAVTFRSKPESKSYLEDVVIKNLPKLSSEQMEKLKNQFDNPQWQKNMDDLKKQLSSPEFKQKMNDVNEKLKELQKQLQSPEFQKQLKEMNPDKIRQLNMEINKIGLMGYPNLSVAWPSYVDVTSKGSGAKTIANGSVMATSYQVKTSTNKIEIARPSALSITSKTVVNP